MREPLTPSQLVTGRRLLGQAVTLREIAARLGVSFEAVCLGLYGDNQSTGASQRRAQTATGVGTGGDHLGPASRSSAPAKTEAPADQSQVSGDGRSQHNSGVRVAPVDTTPAPSEAGQRFKLVSPHGETLHENQRVLTRLPKFFWRGDTAALDALRRRQPQWAHLKAVAVS